MQFNNKYYHGLGCQFNNILGYESNDVIGELRTLELILKSGALLSNKLQNNFKNCEQIGFNGNNYISLCDGTIGKNMQNSAYSMFIQSSISIILDGNIPNIIKPNILPKKASFYTINELIRFSSDMNDVRYTDLYDEVQVKDRIDDSYFVGIGFPIDYYLSRQNNKITVAEFYLTIKEILKKFNSDYKIYDIDSESEVTEEIVLQKLIKYNKI